MKIIIPASSFVSHSDYDTDDKWDRPDTDTTWDFGTAYFADNDEDVKGQDLTLRIGEDTDAHKFVVIAVWSDGDSFGRDTERCAEAVAAYPAMCEAVEAKTKMSTCEYFDYDHKAVDFGNGFSFVPPWTGYFENLAYIEIIEVK